MNEHFSKQIDGTPSETMMLFYTVEKDGVKKELGKIAYSKGNYILLPGLSYVRSDNSIPVFKRHDGPN